MINHITLYVSDISRSKVFYTHILAPLGYRLLKDEDGVAGYGIEDVEGKRDFWIKKCDAKNTAHDLSCLAFQATNKEMVCVFYKAGIEAGGKDNGKPGYHTEYYPGYYAAFVLDLDGNNIEAVYDDLEVMK